MVKQLNDKIKEETLGIVSVVVIFCTMFSCSQGKSTQELLQEEGRAIEKFVLMNDFSILKSYPKDGVFKENEYFKTADGLFFQVVDSGNGNRAQLMNDISVRYEYFQYVKDAASGDTTKYPFPYSSAYYSYGYPTGQPYSFTYGISQTYSPSATAVCQAWLIPLSYVGEGAVVNMIIPSSVGSYIDYSNITPVFYKNLKYTSFN